MPWLLHGLYRRADQRVPADGRLDPAASVLAYGDREPYRQTDVQGLGADVGGSVGTPALRAVLVSRNALRPGPGLAPHEPASVGPDSISASPGAGARDRHPGKHLRALHRRLHRNPAGGDQSAGLGRFAPPRTSVPAVGCIE